MPSTSWHYVFAFIMTASLLAHWFLEEYTDPSNGFYMVMVGFCILSYLASGLREHMFSKIIRYTSMYEIGKSALLMSMSFGFFAIISLLFFKSVSFRFIFLTYMFSLLFILGSRITWRFYHEWKAGQLHCLGEPSEKVRTLVVRAGVGGKVFVSGIQKNPSKIDIVGIGDADPNKQHSLLYNIPVMETEDDIPRLVEELAAYQAFKSNGIAYAEGINHLDGAAALSYSRIRNDQTEQDTGRQARQRRVIQAITDKALTMGTLWNHQELLQTFAANVETNFQTADYLDLQRYGYVAAAKNIKQEALGGVGGLRQDRGLLACGR